MHGFRKYLSVFILIIVFVSPIIFSKAYSTPLLTSMDDMDPIISRLVKEIDSGKVLEHVKFLNSLGTRMTGYPGIWKAAEYIYNEFKKYGLDAYYDNFSVVIPYDYGASLTLDTGETIKIYPLWPNIVSPPSTPGITGKLVYIGPGSLNKIKKTGLKNTIALIDFNCKYDWVRVLGLGAKAVIFLEPKFTTRTETELKKVPMAVNLPRYYMKMEDATKLLKLLSERKEVTGTIRAKMVWEKRLSPNIVAVLPGETDEIIQIWAYFDSYSIVPSVAPGTDEASGIASLLEIARILSKEKPHRTIMFVALSGHFVALSGAREFVEKYFFGEKKKIGDKTVVILGLDFSTDVNTMALYAGVSFWAGKTFYSLATKDIDPFRKLSNLLFQNGNPVSAKSIPGLDISDILNLQNIIGDESLLYHMMKTLKKIYFAGDGIGFDYRSGTFSNNIAMVPTLYIDTEAAAMAGKLAVSFSTSRTRRMHWNTPTETLDDFNIKNLLPQLEFALCSTYLLANLDDLDKYGIRNLQATRFDPGRYVGYLTIKGTVVTYDTLEGRYIPVPNALVYVTSYRLNNYEIVTMTDKEGNFVIHGGRNSLEPVTGGPPHIFEAFKVNDTTGNVIYSEDYGVHGSTFYTFNVVFTGEEGRVTLCIFKSATIALFDLVDPESLESLIFDIKVLDSRSHAEPLQYGRADLLMSYILNRRNYRTSLGDPVGPWPIPVTAVFVPEKIPIELLIYAGPNLVGFLTNNTHGYTLNQGEILKLYVPYDVLRDVHSIDNDRLRTLHKSYVYSGGLVAEKHHDEASRLLNESIKLISLGEYDTAYAKIVKAWTRELRAYVETRSLLYDTVFVAIFYSSILLLFVPIVESVFIAARGLKKIITIAGIAIIFTIIVYFIHPGYTLAANIFLILLGLSVIYLLGLTLLVIINETGEFTREIRERFVGVHEIAKSKFDAFMLAFSFGIGYMKKRKIRAVLTAISIIITVFSLVLLSSAYSYTSVIPAPTEKTVVPIYQGLLVHALVDPSTHTIHTLSINLIDYLRYSFPDAIVSPRTYWRPSFAQDSLLRIKGVNGTATVIAVMGMSPYEENVTHIWSKAGIYGRWFVNGDTKVCIITKDIAKEGGFQLGDRIQLLGGMSYIVIGVIDGEVMYNIEDLNGEPLTPFDYNLLALNPNVPGFPRLKRSFIIIPFKDSLEIGASIINAAVIPKNMTSEQLEKTGIDISFTTGKDVYVGAKGAVRLYRRSQAITVQGWSNVIVPLAIAILVMLDTMLGNVYERTREFSILGTLGLSPMEVAALLFGESLVYAILGGFLGYLSAMIFLKILIFTKTLPLGIPLNYSSWFIVVVILASMGITMASTMYPALRVHRSITPSLARKWKIPKPRGEEWEIRTPFGAMEKEIWGTLSYLKEFFETQGHERAGPFMVIGDIVFGESMMEGRKIKTITTKVSLPPHEQGVTQEVTIRGTWDPSRSLYMFTIYLRHLTGSYDLWVRLNYPFIDALRKQLLIWRGLQSNIKNKYIAKGLKEFRGGS